MQNVILPIIGIVVALFVLVFIVSACILASKSDKSTEEYEKSKANDDNNGLTGLENQSLERLLELYEEDGVNFIINDGKVVDYEVE